MACIVSRNSSRLLRCVLTPGVLVTSAAPRILIPNKMSTYHQSTESNRSNVKPPTMTKSTAEWHYVERLLPDLYVPEPPPQAASAVQPSGWKMPATEKPDSPYFVARTRLHMVPVYLTLLNRGQVRRTVIRRVHGNVWALERDIRAHLEKLTGDIVASTVHEPRLQVILKGDYVNDVKRWLLDKGF